MDGERIAGRVGARNGDALGDRSRALTRECAPEADVLLLESDGESTLDVDLDPGARGAGFLRRWSAGTRSGSGRRVPRGGVAPSKSLSFASVSMHPHRLGRRRSCCQGGRGVGTLVVRRGAVADEVDDVRIGRAAPSRATARERGRVRTTATFPPEFARFVVPVASGCRKRGRRRPRQRRAARGSTSGLNAPGERSHLPARAGGRGVLNRPRAEIDRGRAAVEELDEVVRVRCAAVAAASVQLTDDHVGGSAPRCGHDQQGTAKRRALSSRTRCMGSSDRERGRGFPSGSGRNARPKLSFCESALVRRTLVAKDAVPS